MARKGILLSQARATEMGGGALRIGEATTRTPRLLARDHPLFASLTEAPLSRSPTEGTDAGEEEVEEPLEDLPQTLGVNSAGEGASAFSSSHTLKVLHRPQLGHRSIHPSLSYPQRTQ